MKTDLKSLNYVAIHCEDVEEATKLLRVLEKEGFEWGNNQLHKEQLDHRKPFWSDKYGGTCYILDEGTLWTGTVDYCKQELLDIISYERAVERFF